jgi:hypothetical protein
MPSFLIVDGKLMYAHCVICGRFINTKLPVFITDLGGWVCPRHCGKKERGTP